MSKLYSSKDFINARRMPYPPEFILDPKLRDIPYRVKELYTLLKWRMNLSVMNADYFEDEDGLFVVYPHKEIAEQTGASERAVKDWFAQAEELGLIITKKQGLGRPQKIYLVNISELVEKDYTNGEPQRFIGSEPQRFINSEPQKCTSSAPQKCTTSSRQKFTSDVPPSYRDKYSKDNTENKYEREDARTQNSTRKFVPPTLKEVQSYLDEKGFTWDAEAFIDFYISKDWFVGRNKMKDWRAACRNWDRHRKAENMGSKKTQEPIDYDKKWGIKSYGEDEDYGKDFKGSTTGFHEDDLPF